MNNMKDSIHIRTIKNKWVCVDKFGYPVEGIVGRPFITFLRRLIHTRKITTKETWEKQTGIKLSR